jgi:hypothetical protein
VLNVDIALVWYIEKIDVGSGERMEKTTSTLNNYLEVLVNDEKTTLEYLNKLCGTKHDIFSGARIPKRRLLVEIPNVEIAKEGEVERIDYANNSIVRSKILHHFIKGKISPSPMETILTIPSELESLESLVKLARKKCDEGLKIVNLTKVEGFHVIQRININNNHRNKTLHLLVEINNNLIEGLVNKAPPR